MDQQLIDDVRRILTQYYTDFGRHDMLWRQPELDGSFDPFKILVSELMLQQTQVTRVTPKFVSFLQRFPDSMTLAGAPLGDVLQEWSGLGYNRRAKYLWQAAQAIRDQYRGVFPRNYENLVQLPGVGPNTAGAILAYAYNQPVVYVETNIRTVVIHHFFHDEEKVSDNAIRKVVSQLIGPPNAPTYPEVPEHPEDDTPKSPEAPDPREFYWAMMDYGAYLKATVGNLNKVSSVYAKQAAFAGSKRQLRGQAIRLLTERPYTTPELTEQLNDERAAIVIADLLTEMMIIRTGDTLSLH